MMNKLKRTIYLLGLAALLIAPPAVLAHANYLRSEPAAGSAQRVPPTVVKAWFTEAVEPSFSSLTVVNQATARVDKGDSHRMSDDPTGLEVSLEPNLPPGLYTVIWKTESAVDGHVVSGSFPFTVGDVPLAEAAPHEIMSEVDTALANSAAPPLYQVVIRWLNVLLLSLLAGSFTFPLLILFPALRASKASKPLPQVLLDYVRSKKVGPETNVGLEVWTARWLLFTRIVFGLYALVTIATLVAQAFTVGNVSATILPVLTSTRFGTVWILRVAVLAVLGVILWRAQWQFTADVRTSRPLLIAAGLGLLLAITQSLDSHGAAVIDPPVLPLLVDLIHLFGVAIWVGGLVQLIATVPALLGAVPGPSKMRTMSSVISVFSLVAFLTVGLIVLSGVYSMVIQVGSLEAFFATLYGNTLFVKFVLILPLLALAALNLIVNRNAYARASVERAIPFIHRLDVIVALEVVFAVAVLLAVGYLTSIAPAKEAYNPSSQLWVQTHQVPDPTAGSDQSLAITLGVAPGLVGTNDFDVKVEDGSGAPVSNASVVRLNSSMVEMDMGVQQTAATPQGNGHYTFHGDIVSMAGTWNLEVLVRRPGRDDVRTTFSLFAQSQAAPPGALSPAVQAPEAQVGLGLTLVGFVLGTATVLLLGRKRARWVSLAGAFGVSIIGLLVVYQVTEGISTGQIVVVPVVPAFAHLQPDPVPPIPPQIAAGRQTFVQDCATCHGADGKGDGPAAAALNPKPADLTLHVPLHTEGDLYWWVTHGISGTAMPAWGPTLTDLQRWQVITYLKSAFGSSSPPTPPPAQSSALASPSYDFAGQLAPDLDVSLVVTPTSPTAEDFEASFSPSNQQPASSILGVSLESTWLDQDGNPTSADMTLGPDGHYHASGSLISQPGIWLLRVTAQRAGGPAQIDFPFYQAGGAENSQIDPNGQQILKQSDARMNALKSLKTIQILADGKGGSVTTHYEYVAPDRMLYQVENGIESIAVGATQYDLQDGDWTSRARPNPLIFPSFDNVTPATEIKLGRTDNLGGEPMQIVETTTGSGDSAIRYAFWIGTTDHLVHQYAMLAASHFMMEYYSDYDAPAQIEAPAPGSFSQNQNLDGLSATLSVVPHAAGVSDFDVALSDAAGRPVDDAARVMLVTGMTNMTHPANSILARPTGGGNYAAQGPWLYMGGPWKVGLVVQLAGGQTRTASFAFDVPEASGPVVSQRIDDSPSPVEQINLLVYAGSVVSADQTIGAGEMVRVTSMLMEPDQTRCGGKMTLSDLGLSSSFSSAGLAELQFVAPRAGQLDASCGIDGLVLSLAGPS